MQLDELWGHFGFLAVHSLLREPYESNLRNDFDFWLCWCVCVDLSYRVRLFFALCHLWTGASSTTYTADIQNGQFIWLAKRSEAPERVQSSCQ